MIIIKLQTIKLLSLKLLSRKQVITFKKKSKRNKISGFIYVIQEI